MTIKNGVFIGTDGEFRKVQIDSKRGLQDYYDLIETDIVERITLPVRSGHSAFALVKNRNFEIWCDEEGMYHDAALNTMAWVLFRYNLLGNVVVHGRSLDKFIQACEKSGIEFAEDRSDQEEVAEVQ